MMSCRQFARRVWRADFADDFWHRLFGLSYARNNFPLQKVKIDRSFLEGIDTDRP